MDSRKYSLKRVFIAAVLLTFLSLSAHEAFAHADAAESHCHICAATSSLELNSDCGSGLLVRPDNFILTAPASTGLPVKTTISAAARDRAPPF